MKRFLSWLLAPAVAISLCGCTTAIPVGQVSDDFPAFFADIGKTFGELKQEHPDGEFIVNLNGFPDSFGEQDKEYIYFFFGGHAGDFEAALNEYEDQIKCSGFITTADTLFTNMDADMSFHDFFSLIGVNDYEYFGEETITAKGWLKFTYHGMEVMINTNESVNGGWNVAAEERVQSNTTVSMIDPELLRENQALADTVMFDFTV